MAGKPLRCGRLLHEGPQADVCRLDRGHEDDHEGAWTGHRWRLVEGKQTLTTHPVTDQVNPAQPSLFAGSNEAT